MGDILHMSTGPDSNTWPKHKYNVNNGIPIKNDRTKNCIIKLAEMKEKLKMSPFRSGLVLFSGKLCRIVVMLTV